MNKVKLYKLKGPGILLWLMLAVLVSLPACKTMSVSYSFTGANIDPNLYKSFNVEYFPNRAPVVQPQLSQTFTDALIDKIQSNTSLEMVALGGDVSFSGEIRKYETRPTAITGDERAARNRLTIAIRVVYTNTINPDLSFDSSFSRYEDYDSDQSLADVENELIDLILESILEDIFNKAFVNW